MLPGTPSIAPDGTTRVITGGPPEAHAPPFQEFGPAVSYSARFDEPPTGDAIGGDAADVDSLFVFRESVRIGIIDGDPELELDRIGPMAVDGSSRAAALELSSGMCERCGVPGSNGVLPLERWFSIDGCVPLRILYDPR